jgi:ubiquinone/menaquinone biosynthesis C-methylase UbiE
MIKYTGERYLPWLENAQAGYEHLHRYILARSFAQGKRVLDLASGEGYGAVLLAEVAESVVGLDIDPQTIQHATSRYLRPNLKFLEGSILDIPLQGENLFDLVICFEAIEHIETPERLLGEVKRVLKKDGIFIVSTPNKLTFSDDTGQMWAWHTREFYFPEFRNLLGRFFSHTEFLGQRVFCGSNVWSLEELPVPDHIGSETVIEHQGREFQVSSLTTKTPLFFIALASDSNPRDIQKAIRVNRYLFDASGILLKEKDRFEQWVKDKDQQLQTLHQQLISLNQDKETLANTFNQTRNHLEQITREKDQQLQTLHQQLISLSQRKEALTADLNRIYESHGWRTLLAYYQVRNWIFPPGSKRQDFAKAILHFLLGDKKKDLANNAMTQQLISPKYNRRSPLSDPIDAAACTIISKNYIALARTLTDSFYKFHPDVPFFVLLVDQVDGYFEPEREVFYLVSTDELDIPERESFCFKYNILELNTAVKPYFLSHLFNKYGIKKLIYFDPDILITEKVSHLFELLDHYSIILIPHITEPLEDNFRPSELDLLQAGTYNLGFIGLGATSTTQKLLSWWQKRVYEQCLLAPDRGMHVDQKWIDFVPGLFGEVFIMREPGYNVAYWNLHSRTVDLLDGRIRANGEPCYFFHFSGFDPLDISKVSKHQNRFTLNDLGQAARLFEQYRDLVLANGHEQAKNWPYAFGYFDNGVKIPDAARLMYHGLGPERKEFGNPFSTSSAQSFFSWLNEPASRDAGETITRLWYEIYYKRPDVRQVWPDLFGEHREGFLQWILTSGKREYQIDDRLVPDMAARSRFPKKPTLRRWLLYVYVNYLYSLEQSVKPRLKRTLGRNLWIWNNLKRIRTYFINGRPLPVTSLSPLSENVDPAITDFRPFGVNLAGYFASEKGIGEAGRAAARALEASSIPYVLNNVTDSGSANIDSALSNFTDNNPYSINLIHVNADQVPIFAAVKGDEYFTGRYNVGCWFWELSQFPQEWYSSFQPFNEIWAASSFIQDSLARVSPVPVVRMPLALPPESQIDHDLNRSDFGIPFDVFIFLFTFDFASVLERKNPLGLIKAFKMAFGDRDDTMLLLKVVHSESYPSELNALKAACSTSNIRILNRVLSRPEMNTLISISDCFVSLHRSEGFGIPIAEAMLLEKPVIVTAYSANMDFTTPANSFLVKYKLTEIDRDYGPYRKGWVWADPDLDHAAELMRYVSENRDVCIATGRRAKKEILHLFHPAVAGKQMQERLSRIPWKSGRRKEISLVKID